MNVPACDAGAPVRPGVLYLAYWGEREAYARRRPVVLEPLPASAKKAARVLMASCVSAESTPKTSALVGAVKTLSAMARAVRNRSYVLMAASISDSGALLLRCSEASLASKASAVDLGMGGLLLVEIEHFAQGGQP